MGITIQNVSGGGGGGGGSAVISRNTFSTASTVDITGFDSSLYDAYELNVYAKTSADDARLNLRTSTNGGISYDNGAGNYAYVSNETLTAEATENNTSTTQIQMITNNRIGNAAAESAVIKLTLQRPDATTNTLINFEGSNLTSGGLLNTVTGSGERISAADVDGLQLLSNTGTITGSYVFIGIKKA